MPPVLTTDPKTRLDEIAALMAAGAPAERFQKELDQLLGTEMEDRDRGLEAAFEETYRNQAFVE